MERSVFGLPTGAQLTLLTPHVPSAVVVPLQQTAGPMLAQCPNKEWMNLVTFVCQCGDEAGGSNNVSWAIDLLRKNTGIAM